MLEWKIKVKNLYNASNFTIGVVVPIFWTGQYFSSLKGILDASKHFNINLICFQGTYFSSSYDSSGQIIVEKAGNIIFDLLKNIQIDGLVIHTGSLRSRKHKIELVEMCKKTFSVPMVNVGTTLEGITNIQVDNESGMRDLLHHLIHFHGYKKFGFIKGPLENNDGKIRYKIFEDVLSENSIPIDNDLIIPSEAWSFDFGKSGAQKILQNSHNEVDVIICASDLLATGAISELDEQGIKIPDQIGVVGFNDNNYAEICFPPLTTVQLKMYERSWKAVEILSQCFIDKKLPEDAIIPSSLIVRRSCGCQSVGVKVIETLSTSVAPQVNKRISNVDSNHIEKIISEIEEIHSLLPLDKVMKCVEMFLVQLRNLTSVTFIYEFSELLKDTVHNTAAYQDWHHILNILDLNRSIVCTNTNFVITDCLMMQVRVLIGEIAEQQYRGALVQIEEYTIKINSLNYGFNKVSNLKSIIELMANKLPEIGIPSCYLSLYENETSPFINSKCVLAYDRNRIVSLPSNGILFKSNDLIPDSISLHSECTVVIVEPLFYGNDQFGFTLFEIGSLDNSFYSLFPSQLSAALRSAILYTKEQQTEAALKMQAINLEKQNTELEKRTCQLEEALQKLQENHERLLTSDKMASLGRLTAGITHEMSNPLATLRSTLEEMKRLASEYKESVSDMSVTNEDHHEIVKEFVKCYNLANSAIERAATFISSIKAQTRDVKETEKQLFDIVSIANSVVVFLGYSLKRNNCKVFVNSSDEKIEIYGSPTKLTQVFTNLISNSVDAMKSEGIINITILKELSQKILITVSDDGSGIKEEYLEKIFEPMFTTKPFGKGTGLGLSIVYDIICIDFNGTITVESTFNSGTTFYIELKDCLERLIEDGQKK